MSTTEYVTGGNVVSYQPDPALLDQTTAKLVLPILLVTGMLTIIAGMAIIIVTQVAATASSWW